MASCGSRMVRAAPTSAPLRRHGTGCWGGSNDTSNPQMMQMRHYAAHALAPRHRFLGSRSEYEPTPAVNWLSLRKTQGDSSSHHVTAPVYESRDNGSTEPKSSGSGSRRRFGLKEGGLMTHVTLAPCGSPRPMVRESPWAASGSSLPGSIRD